ncbi:MAG TPA: hypothetical protein VNJ08_16770 [Bacteriovoracaceae bacterium]|nr:hypothetical protein [Bacteriovoracaceae bacterium]
MKFLSLAVFLVIMTSCGSTRDKIVKDGAIQPTLTETFTEKITPESVDQHIAMWPEASQKAYKIQFKQHGIPQGVTNDMLVWNDVGPYRRTIVYKDAIPHRTPRPHVDIVEYFTSGYGRVCDHEKDKVMVVR